MNFHKRMISRIILDLYNVKNQKISFHTLDKNICQIVDAVDSTFPLEVKNIIYEILLKIESHQEEQYISTLNTSNEGCSDEYLFVGNLFDNEISILERLLITK